MKKIVLLAAALLFAITAAVAQTPEEVKAMVDNMNFQATIAHSDGNLKSAENITRQALRIVTLQQPEEDCCDLMAGLWYDVSRYCAMQGKNNEAVEALEKAMENGWNRYEFTMNDQSFSSMHGNKQFRKVMTNMKAVSRTLTAR